MISLRLRTPVILFLLALASACASLRTPDWAHEASDLPPDPAVVYGQLANGMRYAILENDTPSGTAAVRLRIDAGSLHEDEDQLGLAHVLEHMAFNGSENVPEGEMVRILEREGLAFGPDTNAYTSIDETVYMLDLPDVSDDTVDTALFLLREAADKLLIDPDALERERGVVLSEHRVRNTYARRYQETAQNFLFDGVRFPQRDPIGEPDVIANAPAERVRDFYEAYYRPERAVLVFVGDVAPDVIEARIRDTFDDWSGTGAAGVEPDEGDLREREFEASVFVDPEMPTVLTFAAPRDAEPYVDTASARRERLVRRLGFSMLSRRFQRLARDADATFVNASASDDRLYDAVEFASVDVIAEGQEWRAGLEVADQELRRALEHGFTQGELDEQLANLRAGLEAAAEGADTRSSPGLANSLVGSIGGDTVFTHPRSELARFESYADEIAVEEIEAAFRDVWASASPIVFIGTNEPIEDETVAIASAYADSLATAVEPGEESSGAAFAYDDFGAPGVVADRGLVEDLDITRVRFANNVRLNVKPTDFREDRVNVRVRVGAGRLELPRSQPGLESLADSALVAGGLGAHSVDELQSILAGRNVGLNFYTSDDAFVFSAVTTPDELDLQLKLFAAFLAEPGFRDEALARYRRSLDVWYESLDATPQGVQSRDVPRLLRSGDPRYGVPDRDVLLARTLEELRAALGGALNDGAIEIAVVGDIAVDDVIETAAASFGALPTRDREVPALAEARRVRFPAPTREPVVLTHAGEADRALALTYWPTADDSDTQLARELTLAKEVLQLKLTDRVRESEGATYSPSAFSLFSSVNPGYGYIGVSLDIEPEVVERYFGVVDEIVAEMTAGEVSEDELERARAPILESIEENLESNGYWTGLSVVAQSQPRYLGDHRTRAEAYAGITVDDVVAAAAQFLRPERAYRVMIVPESTN